MTLKEYLADKLARESAIPTNSPSVGPSDTIQGQAESLHSIILRLAGGGLVDGYHVNYDFDNEPSDADYDVNPIKDKPDDLTEIDELKKQVDEIKNRISSLSNKK